MPGDGFGMSLTSKTWASAMMASRVVFVLMGGLMWRRAVLFAAALPPWRALAGAGRAVLVGRAFDFSTVFPLLLAGGGFLSTEEPSDVQWVHTVDT